MTKHEPKAPALRVTPGHETAARRYWRRNLGTMAILLVLWAVTGLGCGILFADRLNETWIAGFPLGFWFAQQGSIVVFVLLILAYAVVLNRLDARLAREREEEDRGSQESTTSQDPS